MPKAPVTIYDLNMRRIAMLENAFTLSYETPVNGLWRASFTLPANDPKNAECKPLYFAEIFDGDEHLDLFRILPNTARRSADSQSITYSCEHVLGTLLDDILFQFHTVGNLGYYTANSLNYILQRQTVKRWKIGTVDFARQFEYTWENETLLGAVFSLPKPFDVEFMWTWDTSVYPWTLNLVEPSAEVEAHIRYGVNMQGIEKTVDPSDLCTRLYCLGYGEGVNQLTIAEVNNGLPFLDADNQGQYGILTRVLADRRYTSAETLKAYGQKLLNEAKVPRTTYTVQASELYAITKDPIDRFRTGALVRVIDEEMGEDVLIRVVNKRKSDVYGAPGNVELEIANRPLDLADMISSLQQKQYINDVYAQGATNIDSHDFADNCDPQHPAVLKFYIPEEAVRINKLQLSYAAQPFRAYSKAIEGGGAIATTTAAGGGSTPTTSTKESEIQSSTTSDLWDQFAIEVPDAVSVSGEHNHGIANGTPLLIDGGGSVRFAWSGSHVHSLTSDHRHSVTIPAHDHTVTIQPHAHDISIPNHTHAIAYGIFEGPTPSSVTVKVDGNTVPGLSTNEQDIDIVPFLSKDGEGRVTRGAWHTIEIAPSSLGRIVSTIISQIFVQSRGGGNY